MVDFRVWMLCYVGARHDGFHNAAGNMMWDPKHPLHYLLSPVKVSHSQIRGDLGFYKDGCPIHQKGAPEVERQRHRAEGGEIFFSKKGTLIKRAGVQTPWTPPGSAPADGFVAYISISAFTWQSSSLWMTFCAILLTEKFWIFVCFCRFINAWLAVSDCCFVTFQPSMAAFWTTHTTFYKHFCCPSLWLIIII